VAGDHVRARHIPLGYLSDRLAELPSGVPVVVHCQGGTRSAIAASLLQGAGVRDVLELAEGFAGWEGAGLPVERGAARSDGKPVLASPGPEVP
jgi:hydroxyacylglutathione hydrolase